MKKISLLFLICCIMLCGCEQKSTTEPSATPTDNVETPAYQENQNNDTTQEPTKDVTIDSSVAATGDKDTDMINYFSTAKTTADTYVQDDSNKEKAKGLFKNLSDFIFYDGEINGVKFSELKDDTKKKLVDSTIYVDNKIETKWPGYKETIVSASNKVYTTLTSKLKESSTYLNNKLRDTIGAEAYDSTKETLKEQTSGAKDAINGVISDAKDLGKDAINKVKGWFNKD